MADTDLDDSADWERRTAAALFNRAWDLLEAPRGPAQDRELLATALASWLHWRHVGTARNHAVSDWQVARVWAVLGEQRRAEEHARESLRLAEEHDLGPFYVGYACEALARASVVGGDPEQFRLWMERARSAAARVSDQEARAQLSADLEALSLPPG